MYVAVYNPNWFRGQGAEDSRLLVYSGQRCCLGFTGQRLGIPDKHLLDKKSPCDVKFKTGEYMPGLTEGDYINSHICIDMMKINDDTNIPDEDRRVSIIQKGKLIGYSFIFTDKKWVVWLINHGLRYISKVLPFVQ